MPSIKCLKCLKYMPSEMTVCPHCSVKNKTVAVSGGFDPIHIGHFRLINAASSLGKVIILLNDDWFLTRKKGFVFMPFKERKEILEALINVSEVIQVIDTDDTVCKTLKQVKTTLRQHFEA